MVEVAEEVEEVAVDVEPLLRERATGGREEGDGVRKAEGKQKSG